MKSESGFSLAIASQPLYQQRDGYGDILGMRCLFIVVRNLGYSSHFDTLLYKTYKTLSLDIPREDLALQSSALVNTMIALHSRSDHSSF